MNLSIFENGGATLSRSEEDLAAATVGAEGVLLDQEATMAIVTQPTTPAPQGDRPPRRRGLLLAVLSSLVVAAFIVAAVVFMQDSDKAGTVVADGSTGTTLGTPQTEEQKIIAAYRGYLRAVDEANAPPVNPNSPVLGAFTTGPELQSVVTKLREKAAGGLATIYPPNSVAQQRPRVVSVSGDHASLQSCDVDDSVVVRADTRVPAGPTGVVTLLVNAQLVREGGVSWKVESLQFAQKWEGVSGCAVGRS